MDSYHIVSFILNALLLQIYANAYSVEQN